jgi:hypothetical protein
MAGAERAAHRALRACIVEQCQRETTWRGPIRSRNVDPADAVGKSLASYPS